jgi:hypothetical protein
VKRAPLLAAALFVSAAAAASADPPAPADPKPFKANFIGEGGGYKHPDQATDDYLQNGLGAGAAPAALPPTQTAPTLPPNQAAPSLPARAPATAAAVPVSPRTGAPSRSSSARPAAAERNAPVPGEARPAGRQSLWNGLVQPLDMTAAQAGSADPDAARADADSDYETHILGMQGGPARPKLGARADGRSTSTPAPSAAMGGNKVFVSLTLDPREAGSLRDAVAGLGASTGFAADSRFEAMPGPNGTALISGWLPSARLGDALARPGVKSLRVETRPRPSTPRETGGDFLVGLHVSDPAHARGDVELGARALTAAAGFRLTRVIGLETAPDGRAIAVVAGWLPLSRLPAALELSEVAKISPVGGEPPVPAADASVPAPAGVTGFARFAAERGPWLIILTLLLLLPSLRAPARRLAAVFSPYR